MKDNKHNNGDYDKREDDDKRDLDQDKLRGNTMNEAIREASGDPDMNLNNLRGEREGFDDSADMDLSEGGNWDETRGVNYNANDASGVRGGGIADMDDESAGGAGLNTGQRRGTGSDLNTKKGVSGSDFDGQDVSS